MDSSAQLLDWPGKTDENGNERPAVLHMLDVAACAEQLIKKHLAFSSYTESQRNALLILVASHDIGKLTESFRDLIRKGTKGAPRHWQLSDFMLLEYLDCKLGQLGSDEWVRAELYSAVAGHHGEPPERCQGNRAEKRKRRRAIGCGEKAALDWIDTLFELFPNAFLECLGMEEAKKISWALNGLTVAADWVGSNTEWFPVEQGTRNIRAEFEVSRRRAKNAIEKAGLKQPEIVQAKAEEIVGVRKLRPMQHAVSTIELDEGPILAIIEDSTGTGKTEAALILAQRMMASGKASGLFFALPTTATSDCLFDRIQKFVPKLFKSSPSVILSHGRAKLSQEIRSLRGAVTDKTIESNCAGWLTDNRRRSLLANIGVGTIDQALLSILPTRFSTLRTFGICDKVLIVDEAHSYDRYMEEELKVLLSMQAQLGGSAILMTATLPLAMRRAYVEAFQSGIAGKSVQLPSTRYPSLHMVGRSFRRSKIKPSKDSIRSISVVRLSSETEAIDVLSEAVNQGAACVWIRNAVDDAIAAADELKRLGVEAGLLHARFAMCDRLRLENTFTERFGKKGEGRKGQVLVATQVVEASLDLDFDTMISDLAPIGSLIQRAGRLWRHMDIRTLACRPSSEPILHVVSPDPGDVRDEKWLHDVLQSGAWVYRLNDQWRTADILFRTGEIAAPSGLRKLIEAVHGDEKLDLPEKIEDAQLKADGEIMAEAGLARGNTIDEKAGYLDGTRGLSGDDRIFPTRLGEPQLAIALARRCEKGLIAWAVHDNPIVSWNLSELSVSRKRFEQLIPDQENPEIMDVKSSWPEWRRKACSICVVGDDGQIGEKLQYDCERGLRLRANTE